MDGLTSVQVRGYRAIADARFEPRPDRTALIGGNGSGKSSVLDAIGLVGDLVRHRREALGEELRGNLGAAGQMPLSRLAHFGASAVVVELELSVAGRVYRYRIELAPTPVSWFVAGERLEGPSRDHPEGFEVLLERDPSGSRVRRADGATIRLVPVGTAPHTPLVGLGADPLSYPELAAPYAFLRGICLLRPTPVAMRGGRPLGEFPDGYGRDLTARLHRFLTEQPGQLTDYLETMGEFVGWSALATPVRDGVARAEFREGTHPTPIALEAASDGTVVEAWLLALALDPPEGASVLLVDEPASQFFHRSLQRPAQLLKTLSMQRQVIVATHSPGLLSEFTDRDGVWVVSRQAGAGAQLRRLVDLPDSDEAVTEVGLGEGALGYGSEVAP
ncbi:MAG: AAA family ATPase [Myxococcota bacterium]